ncbi:MAG TPA: HGxxPAAW family protein [Propionibacteriaceae bacterium]|nr:HGxxPAAW family protein [Propionibacteriaceae bacterium]
MSDVAKGQSPRPSTLTEPSLRRHQTREYHHGRSPASWVGSMTALAGALIGTVGFFVGSFGVIVTGFVVIGLALVATVMLRALGYGQATDDQGAR